LGFLRGGPVGALIGGAIEHFIRKKITQKMEASLPGVANRGIFVSCLIVILTRVGMAKGPLTPKETGVIQQFLIKNLNYSNDDLKFINDIVQETQKLKPNLEAVVEQYRKAAGGHYKFLILATGYQIALIGNGLEHGGQEEINRLARLLGVTYEDHDRIRRKYSLDALRTPYTILGIPPTSTNEKVKKAYREMAQRYHPDRFAHEGTESAEAAHLKFLEIQEAFQEVQNLRGL